MPADVSVLLLTQPQTEFLPGEADKIKRYLARGGNLLWLVEPGALHGLAARGGNAGLGADTGRGRSTRPHKNRALPRPLPWRRSMGRIP